MSIRMRHTSGHTRNRRSHHALKGESVVKDKESGNARLSHHIDEVTGMYRGKQIFAPKAKAKTKHEKKTKGPDTEPAAKKQEHDRAHEDHANADIKSSKGILGKIASASRPKARSGFGGGA